MDVDAITIPNSDHHTLCTFGTRHERGYDDIARAIESIQRDLTPPLPTVNQRWNFARPGEDVLLSPGVVGSRTWPSPANRIIQRPLFNVEARFVLDIERCFEDQIYTILLEQLSSSKLYTHLADPMTSSRSKLPAFSMTPSTASPSPETFAGSVSIMEPLSEEPQKDQRTDEDVARDSPAQYRSSTPTTNATLFEEPRSFAAQSAWDKSSILSIGQYITWLFVQVRCLQ